MFYIGKGSEFRSSTTKNRNKNWHDVVEKEGGFKSEILAKWESEQEALDHEKFLIETFRGIGVNLVNITSGGQGVSGLKHSDDTKSILKEKSLMNGSVDRCKAMAIDPIMIEKRRLSATGKKRTEASKLRMAMAKQYKARPLIVCGKSFSSIAELARFLGMYKTTLRRWIDSGNMNKVEELVNAKIS
jgi:hypothetical protein